jgi:hypothetical protein
MARFKDFGSEKNTLEPIVFKIHGEEFTCLPAIQGKTLLDLIASSSSDDPAVASAVTLKFFERVLSAESLIRFNTLLDSKDKIVSIETLTDISTWLIEEYTSRPNQPSEASSTGE